MSYTSTPPFIIEQQPDTANTGGSTFLDGLENTALNTLKELGGTLDRKVADSGAMPYDPNDPNFRSLVQVRNASSGFNIGTSPVGLLVIGGIIWAIARKK